MLCSMCKKNTAVIFINKQGADGKAEVEGLCYECAKKKGINPIDTWQNRLIYRIKIYKIYLIN